MILYYMRDNHTFRRLPLDVEQAVAAVREEFEDGNGGGMLCTKSIPHQPFGSTSEPNPHLRGPFATCAEAQVRAWMQYALSYKSPGDLEYESWTHGVSAAPAPAGKPPEDSYPDQTILHAEGECGNCLQATIAGVLGWPLAAVPHFALLGEDHWWDCAQAWLNSQGYWIDYQPTSYAAEGGELMPRCWLSGRSPRGLSHAVVGDSATLQMLHDPHPSRAGLVEHSYTIYFFRKPAAGVGGNCHQTFPHEPPMKDSP